MVLTMDPNKFPPNTELMYHQSWDFDTVPPQETTADPNTEVIYNQTRDTGIWLLDIIQTLPPAFNPLCPILLDMTHLGEDMESNEDL